MEASGFAGGDSLEAPGKRYGNLALTAGGVWAIARADIPAAPWRRDRCRRRAPAPWVRMPSRLAAEPLVQVPGE